TLLSAFKVLLNKYTGQDDICVGSPIANRTRSEIEPLIGFFVNTLALRSNLSEDIRFVDLLKQVKQTTLDAYDNQDMPFEKVVDIVQPGRNLSYSPLFQVMMVLQNNPASELSFGELSLKPVEFESTISKFDLTLNFTETTEGLVGGIEYNTDLFDKARIERMTEHFNVLVESIISNPTVNISELEILTSAEKYKLLTEWNNTEADYPKDKCIHQLFEEQVKKTPANIAVVFENKQLSYQELNDKSNQLAHYLQSKGVKPESLVGICVDRSIAMIVGLLGILKAGGAYVPIDPTYPEGRISYMLEDVDCEIVLSQKHLELPKNNSEIIYLDTDWDKIENKPTENVKSEVKSDNLAYVIYTSGSTGKPKGVCIEQKNITNLINFTYNKTNIELSSVLQFISISFDVSAQEIFGTILCGGKLCLVDDEIRINTNKLFKLISNNNIKTVFWPVSFIKMLFNNDNYGLIPQCIRHIITAGEQLVISNTFSKYLKENDVFLHNHYGPSESHVVTALTLNPGEEHPNLPPIGIPIDNTQLYIIDKNLDLVPIGVPGELCISGEQLGRGYFKRPELTAEKFIQNPFSNDPNSRLYKTGDLVKYLPDGNIEFIGRIDSQVKIRGFRIELGEVENVLQTHESISEGVVLAREENGDKYLCAYIVTNQGINQEKLRAFLSTRLPDYMIPSYFVELDKMPLTANGKINRKALPSPEVKAGDDYVAPSNEIEEKLVVIWSEVLNIPKQEISIRANFFAIGGHSLKASNCVNKLINTFHLNIPLIEIFKNPTIVQLANFISADKLNTAVYDDNLALLKKGDVNGTNIFLIHDGSGEINGYIEFCKQADNGINYWGIRAGNMKKHEPVNFTIEQLAKKYLKCVRKIQDHGEYNIAGWSLGGTIAFEMIRQLEQENENVRFLGIMDSMPPNISKNANAVEFTVESELSWIRNYIDNDEVIAGFNAKSDLKDFWYDIIDYLKNIDEIVKDVIIKNIGFEIKESKKSSVEELIKHMNFVRSLSRACNYYKPENAIVSQINYFSASDSKNAFINGWRENSSKDLIVREIEGTHFSIFTLPSVIGLHKAFEACFNNTVDNVFSVNIN
ncbi:MAG: amino acid adenylation domain-containing protein, partial [bacterium]|nr:amino acid adenylation domain-containing protein [bacterium]